MSKPDRDVILVFSSGHSGSSALTRVLSLCGCTLPRAVFAPHRLNPTGFWEPVEATMLNIDFMIRHDAMENDPVLRLAGEIRCDEPAQQAFIQSLRSFLRACPDGPALLLKGWGMAELMEFWVAAAHAEGRPVKIVLNLRKPNEVFASYGAASGEPLTVSALEMMHAVWLKQNVRAERYAREHPHVVVEYANLMRDWRTEVARVQKALFIDVRLDSAAVDTFLRPDLYHQRDAVPLDETYWRPWISKVYANLACAARDMPINSAEMDAALTAYRSSERVPKQTCDFKRTFDPQRLREGLQNFPVWQLGTDY